ncbi:plasma membrane localization protein [Aspergillus nanangensis]|uniref:Plasma membrane localization protein n=1 Tax=Aspergillus nanangensis TaxID=2582783 RepID=A0AAD4CKC4_ASPNN|nr:plasma membrane localization protein [Aspergillus nanangensis]
MEGVRQKCRPKHQVLVLKCYPQYQKGVQEVKPNSSELSYMLYYVSTRRSKLTKVGAFLEKRAARDVWRRKIGNVQVTLQILSALIEKVPRDLPIYARSVMTVLETVLRSREISLVEDSIATFETFCRHQDTAALSAEQDFANQYREVVRTYASFADVDPVTQSKAYSTPPLVIRWRNAGLRAIKAVVGSEAGLAADGGDSLRIILPVILENLYSGDDNFLLSLESKLEESEKAEQNTSRPRRLSTTTVQTVDTAEGDPALANQTTADMDRKAEMDVRLLALRCLESIVVTGSSRGQIRVTTKVILDVILRKRRIHSHMLSLDGEGNWATTLVELVAKWCPVQVRFIILASAMEFLHGLKPTDQSTDEPFTILYIIDRLLKSPVNMIGLSVIDILLGLMQYMSSVISPAQTEKTKSDSPEKQNGYSEEKPTEGRMKLLALLQSCIGDLTTHIYYGDQVVDMIRTILTRIKPSQAHEQLGALNSAQVDVLVNGTSSTGSAGDSSSLALAVPSAKITALKAIKNVLLVANSKKEAIAAGVEARHQVGIHVWEGTEFLLREPDRNVRYAYVDAFLTWLKLETNKNDLKVKQITPRNTYQSSRRELPDIAEKPAKRNAPVGNQRERAIMIAQSNYLRLLHLTVYDLALEFSHDESDIALLHLLLACLVDHLGVNAAKFGIPMVMRLQEDMGSLDGLDSCAKVSVGSLVYGYLWALSEKFKLGTSRIGNLIQSEIETRHNYGLWVQGIQVPPLGLDCITQTSLAAQSNGYVKDTTKLTPFFGNTAALITGIEEAYNNSTTSAAQSPPGSPGRSFTSPVLGHALSAASAQKGILPSSTKEQMMSSWSRETCMADAEKEKSEAMSLSGSKAGTFGMRNHIYQNGNGDSSPSTYSRASAQQAAGVAAGLQDGQRASVPNSSASIANSSRESPVHVTELKRVLSVKSVDKNRRLSPLRGRLDASNNSISSSSGESMVSGFSLSEMDADGISLQPQSTKDGQHSVNGDGTETPKGSGVGHLGEGSHSRVSLHGYDAGYDNIPPVPPIPPTISLPGGFPNDSPAERPSTAPGSPKSPAMNGKSSSIPHGKTLSKNKSRSSTGLSSAAGMNGGLDGTHFGHSGTGDDSDLARHDVQKLLGGLLSPADAESRSTKTRARGSYLARRSMAGGIGRPPY